VNTTLLTLTQVAKPFLYAVWLMFIALSITTAEDFILWLN